MIARLSLVLLIAVLLSPATIAEAPAQPPAPAPAPAGKLELPAPFKVAAGSGYAKVAAKGSDKVAYDVFSVLDDPQVKIQADTFGNVLVVGIPNIGGTIRVTAAAVVAGAPVLASTTITIESAADRPAGSEDGGTSTKPSPPPPAGPLLHVTVVGLSESAALRKGLEDAGLKYWPYPQANDPRLATKGLDRQVQKAGGAPAVIVQDASGKVLAAKKIAGDQDVADVVNQVRGAK